jgi:hypothetical protein
MWGRTWEEAIGKNCLELGYEPWHAAMHDREIEQVVATRQPVRGEVPFNGTFGHRYYDYLLVPVIGANGEVEQAGYAGPFGPKCSIAGAVGQPTAPPPQFIAGVTAPEWGMPYCGTPIGLPGPPHIPLGVPAGLQRHVMHNKTKMHIPGPTKQVKISVKQEPGLSYPKPASHVHIVERSTVPPVDSHTPWPSPKLVKAVACQFSTTATQG